MDELNLKQFIAKLEAFERPTEEEVAFVCSKAKEILVEESNVVLACSPIKVVGNIHGQMEDLLDIFARCGQIPNKNYLFLGGYVNRGINGLEVLCLLLSYKILYPDKVILLRGNHESRAMTQCYGFYDECCKKFGSINAWRDCTDLFDYLPLAATIDEEVYAVQGGISDYLVYLNDILKIDRKKEVPDRGPMADILWSDPSKEDNGYRPSPRTIGKLFGETETLEFIRSNKLKYIVRAHEMVPEGLKSYFDGKILSVWSAPNYCNKCHNKGAVLTINTDKSYNVEYFESKSLKRNESSSDEKTLEQKPSFNDLAPKGILIPRSSVSGLPGSPPGRVLKKVGSIELPLSSMPDCNLTELMQRGGSFSLTSVLRLPQKPEQTSN